jgi:hypothetical protein
MPSLKQLEQGPPRADKNISRREELNICLPLNSLRNLANAVVSDIRVTKNFCRSSDQGMHELTITHKHTCTKLKLLCSSRLVP